MDENTLLPFDLPAIARKKVSAYWLMFTVRDAIPKAHALATAEFTTLGLRLLKLGARAIEMASRVRLAFAAACPDATLIRQIAAALMPARP